jgi:acetoin utilization protein AcuB
MSTRRRDMAEQHAAEIMTRDPLTISINARVADAVNALQTMHVRHLPVVDDRNVLVGIVSDRDLGSLMKTLVENADVDRMGEPPDERDLADFVSADPIAVHEDTPVSEIIDTLVDERVGAVPVVDDADHVVGIISYVDLLLALRPDGPAATEMKRTPRLRGRTST